MPQADELAFSVGCSEKPSFEAGLDEAIAAASRSLSGSADLALVFASGHSPNDFERHGTRARTALGTKVLLGCTAESLVAGGREIEQSPAVVVWLGRFPGATLTPMNLDFESTPEGSIFHGWPDSLPEPWPAGSVLLVLGEPFSFPADQLLARLNEDHPGTIVVGGMASGGQRPGEHVLFQGERTTRTGAVAVLLNGVRARSVVSQGCRPIGQPFIVTKSHDNIVEMLGGKPALEQLQSLYERLPTRDQRLAERGLHLGRVLNEYQAEFARGDFLVRNVIGADPENGSIAIGDMVRTGQTVQFHVRDRETADEDLRQLLTEAARASRPSGGLLFTCNGRGTRLFAEPDHDAGVVRECCGAIPLAGFFAAGEIGPVAGKSFLHGFTASMLFFDSPT